MKKKKNKLNGQEPLDFDGILDAIGDPTQNKHGGNPQSNEAYGKSDRTTQRGRCKSYIAEGKEYGATFDEASIALGMAAATTSARFTELKATREVIPNGTRRKTRWDCWATVVVINPNPPTAEQLAEEKAARRAARKAAKNGYHNGESNQDNEEWWL